MGETCECTHEEEIILMKDHVKDIGIDTKRILKLLMGNGEPGVMGKILLQDQCLKKLHKRLDEYEANLKEMKREVDGDSKINQKAVEEKFEKLIDKIDKNTISKKSIRSLWIALGLLASPVLAACIKIIFFGTS